MVFGIILASLFSIQNCDDLKKLSEPAHVKAVSRAKGIMPGALAEVLNWPTRIDGLVATLYEAPHLRVYGIVSLDSKKIEKIQIWGFDEFAILLADVYVAAATSNVEFYVNDPELLRVVLQANPKLEALLINKGILESVDASTKRERREKVLQELYRDNSEDRDYNASLTKNPTDEVAKDPLKHIISKEKSDPRLTALRAEYQDQKKSDANTIWDSVYQFVYRERLKLEIQLERASEHRELKPGEKSLPEGDRYSSVHFISYLPNHHKAVAILEEVPSREGLKLNVYLNRRFEDVQATNSMTGLSGIYQSPFPDLGKRISLEGRVRLPWLGVSAESLLAVEFAPTGSALSNESFRESYGEEVDKIPDWAKKDSHTALKRQILFFESEKDIPTSKGAPYIWRRLDPRTLLPLE